MSEGSMNNEEGRIGQPPFVVPGASFSTQEMVDAVEELLKAALVTYADILPRTLIYMGKFALAAPGKVLTASLPGEPSRAMTPPLWPMLALLGCQAAAVAERGDTWKDALPAAVAMEIAIAAADLIDELTDDDPSPFVTEYGPGQALNTGSLMLVMAQQILLRDAIEAVGSARFVRSTRCSRPSRRRPPASTSICSTSAWPRRGHA